ncbi:MAG: hypothetical protein WBG92_08190 [Thiohalocapsa sp.]
MSVHRAYGREGLKQAAAFWSLRVSVILVVAILMLYAIAVWPGSPYHVRELFGSSASLPQASLFALVVLFALGPPAMLGLQLVRLPARYVWLFPIGILVHACVVFLGFRFATPIASVHDMLGTPVWGIGEELERLIRFVGIFLIVSVPISGGTALLYGATRAYAPRRVLWWVLFQILFLILSYWIVLGNAATDNIRVLLRASVGPLAWIGFALWLLCLAFAASLLAQRVADVFKGTTVTAFAVVLFLPLSYGLLFLALEQNVGGPQAGLSALDFLLSPSRSDYDASSGQLFLRYTLAYLGAILLLACSQYPAWLAYSTRRFTSLGTSFYWDLGMDSEGLSNRAPRTDTPDM